MVEQVHVTQSDPEVIEYSIQLLDENPNSAYLADHPNLVWINKTDGRMYINESGAAESIGGGAPEVHSHTVAQITDFDPASKAAAVHSHTQAQITDLDAAPSVHSHTVAQITDFDPATKLDVSLKGAVNGVAELDGGGKIPSSQLPSAIMTYKGTWAADTNTPDIANGSHSAGAVFRVTAAGSHNFGQGSIDFEIGDYAILNDSSIWEKSDTTDAVSSVNPGDGAQVGDINLSSYFAAKSAAVHSHLVADITDFDPADKADAVHSHLSVEISDATDIYESPPYKMETSNGYVYFNGTQVKHATTTGEILAASVNGELSIYIPMKKIGSPVADIRCKIYSGSATPDSLVASSTNVIAAADLTAGPVESPVGFTDQMFNFSGLSLSAGTQYWISLEEENTVTMGGGRYVALKTDDSLGSPWRYGYYSGSWTWVDGKAILAYTLNSSAEKIVKTDAGGQIGVDLIPTHSHTSAEISDAVNAYNTQTLPGDLLVSQTSDTFYASIGVAANGKSAVADDCRNDSGSAKEIGSVKFLINRLTATGTVKATIRAGSTNPYSGTSNLGESAAFNLESIPENTPTWVEFTFPSPHSVPNASKVHLALEEISIANGTIQIRGNGGAQTNYTLSSIQTGFSGWAGSVASLCYEVFTPGVEETITDGKVVKTSSAGKLDVSLIPAIGNEFDFTATGSLTSSSTAYVCDKMGEYPQDISALKNVSGQGWTPVDVTDIVWVTADDNKYLRGDIDALNPSGSETIKIRVR